MQGQKVFQVFTEEKSKNFEYYYQLQGLMTSAETQENDLVMYANKIFHVKIVKFGNNELLL